MLRERYNVATAMFLHDKMNLSSSVRIDFFREFFVSLATYAINTSSLTKRVVKSNIIEFKEIVDVKIQLLVYVLFTTTLIVTYFRRERSSISEM